MPSQPRSLAEDLRARSDDELAALLRLRPDLASPLPTDLAQLAARSHTAASTVRALDRLDRFTLQVLDVVVVLPEPVSREAASALLPDATPDDVEERLSLLRQLALVWGDADGVRPTSTVRESLGAAPAGLGPWAAQVGDGRPCPTGPELDALLADAPAGALAALDQLVWGPPHGAVERADREVTPDEAATPVDWLLAHRLLLAADARTVVLPRDVALQLRGDRVHERVEPAPPNAHVTPRDPAVVDRAAAGSAFDAVRRVEDLLEAWSYDPPGVLKAGGLGVRDLRAAAAALDVDEATAALLVETAYDAGLLAADDDAWLPTPAYDAWRVQPAARRWTVLAGAWLGSTRVVALVGSKDAKGARINALGPELDLIVAPEIRRAVLADLAGLGEGAAATVADLDARQAWRRPRRGARRRSLLVEAAVAEGSALGVVALGAVASPARQLLAGDVDAAADAVDPLLPTPVRHVLLQADLTAVAPGPLDGDVAREFALVADVESSGGATVFRFTEASVRRALDAGRSGADVVAFLGAHSRTEVPQPLAYLVDDVARRHGRLRVGPASAYLRCDDPAVLDELQVDRRAAGLRLRRLAPTVLAAAASPEVVLDQVRRMGMLPAAETPEGAVVVRRPDARRTPPRQRPPRLVGDLPVPSAAVLTAAVRALRAGDLGEGAREDGVVGPAAAGELPRTAVADTLDLLRQAVEQGRSVLLGYVGTDGTAAERVVDPVEVRGGWLTAYDHRYEQVRTFAVHRIAGAALLTPGPGQTR